MKDFSIREVIGLMARTSSFLVFRFLVYFAITLAYVLVTGAGAGMGWMIGGIGDNAAAGGMWGGIIGFGLVSVVMYLLREYLLYLVKAGHIAVLVEILDGGTLPEGRGQIDHAQQVVRERFGEASVLFGVDQLIKAVLKTFNRAFLSVASLIPIPGLKGVVSFINTVIRLSLTYLDEVILAYNIRERSDNPWATSRTALILYAQNYRAFLRNAFFLAFFIWGLTLLVFLLILGPVAALTALFPGTAGPITLMIAVVFAWGVKQAVIEPIGMTALMQVFFKVTEGQSPDPEWEARLEKLSGKFRAFADRASSWASGRDRAAESVDGAAGSPDRA